MPLLVTACSTLLTHVDKVEVPVAIEQTCISAADVPVIPVTHMLPGANIERLMAAASADLRELAAYAAKVHALLLSCAEQPKE